MSRPQRPPISGFSAYQRGRIYALDAQDQPAELPGPQISVEFGELSATDADALATAMDQSPSVILERLNGGRRCFVAWHGGEIASYCWVSLQQEYVGEMESVLDIQSGEAYIWNCATLPQYRRNGIYTALLPFIVKRLSEDSIQRIWIGADLENTPSHRAFHSAGFLPAAEFVFFRVWRLYGFYTRARPLTPPHYLTAARRLFRINRMLSIGPLSLAWRKE